MVTFLNGLVSESVSVYPDSSSMPPLSQELLQAPPLDPATTSFLDLGTGNGSLLHALRSAGWAGRCLGVDYSPGAVALARQVADSMVYSSEDNDEDEDEDEDKEQPTVAPGQQQHHHQQQPEEAEAVTPTQGEKTSRRRRQPPGKSSKNPIEFAQWDVLKGPLDDTVGAGRWDVVLDKGTFDAVCLSSSSNSSSNGNGTDEGEDQKNETETENGSSSDSSRKSSRPSEMYGPRVLSLLRPGDGGLFLVTSCNWTEQELRAWFEGRGSSSSSSNKNTNTTTPTINSSSRARFEFAGRVNHRSFSFGGVQGQTISTVCFVKRES